MGVLLGASGALAAADDKLGVSPIAAAPAQRVTLAWRDSVGKDHAATIEKAKLATFLEQQSMAAAWERDQTRAAVTKQLAIEIAPIFAVLRDHAPRYTDWYFGYKTKYVLMSRALRAALTHVTMDMRRSDPHRADFIHAIETSLTAYLEWQFAARVMMSSWTPGEIETAYARVLTTVHAQWGAFLEDQDRRLVEFVEREATPVAAPTALGLGRADRAPLPPLLSFRHHEEVLDVYAFRRGLLKITVDRPRAMSAGAIATQGVDDDAAEAQDKISQTMVDLFTRIVDPVASRVGDLVVSMVAGGAAGAVAGGSNLTLIGMAGTASGAASVVPVAALFAAAISLSTDYAASKFEERLTRPSFERKITEIISTTEALVSNTLTSILGEHIEAWHDDVLADIDRLIVTQ